MKRAINNTFFVALVALLACAKANDAGLEEKKAQLEEKKRALIELKKEIKALESEIAAADPGFSEAMDKSTLITALNPVRTTFIHKIEARGSAESRSNVVVGAESMGRLISVRVKDGQKVEKGQLLATIDSDIFRKNLAELENQLELATVIYEKQSRLWGQKVGTEVQYLQAKSTKESLENQIASLKVQLAQCNVVAPVTGTVDEVLVREGEVVSPGLPVLRIVGTSDIYLKVDISERYLDKVKVGDEVTVRLPAFEKEFKSKISAVGSMIKSENRTISIEVSLPSGNPLIRPNITALVDIVDYVAENAIVVPSGIILNDNRGDFVYRVVDEGGLSVVRKAYISRGMNYQGQTEIIKGVTPEDVLVNDGARDLSQGVQVRIKKG